MHSNEQRSRWAGVAGLGLTGLVIVLGNMHLCHLHSAILEVPMLLGLPLATWYWARRAATPARAWRRVGISLVFVIVLQTAYLDWLHSPSFPQALLSRSVRERQAELEAARAKAAAQPQEPKDDRPVQER